MDDDLKPLKSTKNHNNDFKKKSFDFNYAKSSSNSEEAQSRYVYEKPKDVKDVEVKRYSAYGWILQSILCLIYFKIFGALPGLCGIGAFYALKKKFGIPLASLSAVVVSVVVWFIAYSLINAQ